MNKNNIPENIKDWISPNKVVIFSKSYCPYCQRAKSFLNTMGVSFEYAECDQIPFSDTQSEQLQSLTGISTFPNIFIGTKSIGGCDSLMKLHSSGHLTKFLDEAGISYIKEQSKL